MESISYLEIFRERTKQAEERMTAAEHTDLKSLAGTIIWLGGGVSPQESFPESYLQKSTADLRVKHLTEVNKLLKQLKQLPSTLKYKKGDTGRNVEVVTFADACFHKAAGLEYGQTGVVVGIVVPSEAGRFYHVIVWMSQKQRRISHYFYGAEIIACADGADHGFNVKNCVRKLAKGRQVEHNLHVNSKGLFDTITTLHNEREYMLRQIVQRNSDRFKAGETPIIRWVQSKANIADAHTKWSPEMEKTLSNIIYTGKLLLPEQDSKQHNAAQRK